MNNYAKYITEITPASMSAVTSQLSASTNRLMSVNHRHMRVNKLFFRNGNSVEQEFVYLDTILLFYLSHTQKLQSKKVWLVNHRSDWKKLKAIFKMYFSRRHWRNTLDRTQENLKPPDKLKYYFTFNFQIIFDNEIRHETFLEKDHIIKQDR